MEKKKEVIDFLTYLTNRDNKILISDCIFNRAKKILKSISLIDTSNELYQCPYDESASCTQEDGCKGCESWKPMKIIKIDCCGKCICHISSYTPFSPYYSTVKEICNANREIEIKDLSIIHPNCPLEDYGQSILKPVIESVKKVCSMKIITDHCINEPEGCNTCEYYKETRKENQ